MRDGDAIPGIVGGEADGFYADSPKPAAVRHTLLSASEFRGEEGDRGTMFQHTSLYETERGAIVFDAGTFNWSLGLNHEDYIDPRIQQATANLFNRLRR